jgi:hypothetical protein
MRDEGLIEKFEKLFQKCIEKYGSNIKISGPIPFTVPTLTLLSVISILVTASAAAVAEQAIVSCVVKVTAKNLRGAVVD